MTIISSQSTQKERRTVWIESLLGERSSLYGTRDVLRYPVEHYSQITYYLPHIQGEWYHMLHHYRILDFLEAMRVYLGIRVRINFQKFHYRMSFMIRHIGRLELLSFFFIFIAVVLLAAAFRYTIVDGAYYRNLADRQQTAKITNSVSR